MIYNRFLKAIIMILIILIVVGIIMIIYEARLEAAIGNQAARDFFK